MNDKDIQSKDEIIKFNDLYYASYMLKCDENNLEFYLKESVQKIIDFQWLSTFIIYKCLFFVYLLFYLTPVCIVFFTENDELKNVLLEVACVPSLLLFLIETVQMREQGLEYFMGWNVIDFLQFFSFCSL